MNLPNDPIRLERLEEDRLWRAVLATPRANLLDAPKLAALDRLFEQAAAAPRLRAVVIDADGPDFSYGASVQEHLPGEVEAMIPAFGRLFDSIHASGVFTLAAVRGRCLGGGLELASFCHRVFCAPGAALGQPEIALGVFAPVASAFLVERMGRGAAEDLLVSGRSVGAEEALRTGLVDELADDPTAAALAYAREHLLPKSARSLRFAVRAARAELVERFCRERLALERVYLEELMATRDAHEGLHAFLERRPPSWQDR